VKTCPGTGFFGGNKVADCQANFLPLVSAALATTSPAAVIPLGQLKVVSADGLTIRSAPKVSGSPLGTLPNGAIVQIFQAEGIWRKIDPVQPRWVSSKFLTPA
jgi:hypothetical protein